MPRFFRAGRTYIRADEIIGFGEAHSAWGELDPNTTEVLLRSGREIEVRMRPGTALRKYLQATKPEAPPAVMPAREGQLVLVAEIESTPLGDAVHVGEAAVVAWRISGDKVEPVTVPPLPGRCEWALLEADGTVFPSQGSTRTSPMRWLAGVMGTEEVREMLPRRNHFAAVDDDLD